MKTCLLLFVALVMGSTVRGADTYVTDTTAKANHTGQSAQFKSYIDPTTGKLILYFKNADGTASSGLTDTQLRAAAVPVSLASVPLPAGAATSANQTSGAQKSQIVNSAGTNTMDVDATGAIKTQPGVTTVTPSVITTSTKGGVTATTTSSTALAANASRLDAVITNTGTSLCYIARGATATAGQGIPLNPGSATTAGGSYNMNSTNLYRGIITVITASGTTTLAISEGQ